MPKPIPPVDLATSVPPDLQRHYFAEYTRFPFDPAATEFSLNNAWWLAEASFAAYATFHSAGKSGIDLSSILEAGYSVNAGAVRDTQFLAIENGEALIVAFRGTRLDGFTIPFLNTRGFIANWGDVVTDARFLPKIIESEIFAHEGFLSAFRAIEDQFSVFVDKALAEKRPVWFCGHSLGAALATLAAYRYRDRAQGLYTFGSPRVGNGAFVQTLTASLRNIYRFVHHRDVITTVPPEGLPISFDVKRWLDILKRLPSHQPQLGYAHVGTLKFISGGHTWKIQDADGARTSIDALAADAYAHAKEVADVLTSSFSPTDPGSWPIVYDAVADHAPVYYANKVFNACEAAKLS